MLLEVVAGAPAPESKGSRVTVAHAEKKIAMDHKPVAGLCRICGKALRPGESYSWREVTGWQQLGPNGKARAAKLLKETGLWECQPCHMTTTSVQEPLL